MNKFIFNTNDKVITSIFSVDDMIMFYNSNCFQLRSISLLDVRNEMLRDIGKKLNNSTAKNIIIQSQCNPKLQSGIRPVPHLY